MNQLSVETIVKDCHPRFMEVAKSNGELVKWQKESQFAIQALQKNQKLSECAKYTIENSIINVAACGLSLNPADGYAYLVPEYNKDTKQMECQLRISFKGLIKSATDTGVILWVRAEVVKEADTFTYRGVSQEPIHEMNPFAKDRGDNIGVYCVAKTCHGDILTDVMAWDEVMKIKNAAKTKFVWDAWEEEMAKKAIIKRASKQWAKSKGSETLHQTIQVLNDTEGSEPLVNYTGTQKERFDKYIEDEDELRLFLFTKSLDEDVFISLYNSFEKGKKTSNKKLCNELIDRGFMCAQEIVEVVTQQVENGDPAYVENLEGLADDEKKILASMFQQDTLDKIKEMRKGEK